AGPDGALWFAGATGVIGWITTSGAVTEFSLPKVPPPPNSVPGLPDSPITPSSIAVGSDGALWFGGIPGAVGRITTSGAVTQFPVPKTPPPPGYTPAEPDAPATVSGITAMPDGALWFTGTPGQVGRITTSGVVTEIPLSILPPAPGSPDTP